MKEILLLTIVITLTLVSQSKALDAKFEYYVFENFETTKNIFVNERKIIGYLLQITKPAKQCDTKISVLKLLKQYKYLKTRTNLSPIKTSKILSSLKWNHNYEKLTGIIREKCIQLKNQIIKNKVKNVDRKIIDVYSKYATNDVLMGAAKGILMLQEAYDINIEKTVDGLLTIPDINNSKTEVVKSHGRLSVDDFLLMLVYSYQTGWISKARQFLQPIEYLLQNEASEDYLKNGQNQRSLHEAFIYIKKLLDQKYGNKEDVQTDLTPTELTSYTSSSGTIEYSTRFVIT